MSRSLWFRLATITLLLAACSRRPAPVPIPPTARAQPLVPTGFVTLQPTPTLAPLPTPTLEPAVVADNQADRYETADDEPVTQPVSVTNSPPPPAATLQPPTDDRQATNCPHPWFFVDTVQTGSCPHEALTVYAAAQRFERGTMIWLGQLGRYLVLDEAILYEGELRRQVSTVYDPLDFSRDTSAEINPPDGLYAPTSGIGLVWRGDVDDLPGYQERLGWALAPEFGYNATYQCDSTPPSGGRSWQFCFLSGPDGEVWVFHPLGGWLYLEELS